MNATPNARVSSRDVRFRGGRGQRGQRRRRKKRREETGRGRGRGGVNATGFIIRPKWCLSFVQKKCKFSLLINISTYMVLLDRVQTLIVGFLLMTRN